jgi:hypothetical protein
MNTLKRFHKIIILLIVTLPLAVVLQCGSDSGKSEAEETTTSISGHVTGRDGRPLGGVSVGVYYYAGPGCERGGGAEPVLYSFPSGAETDSNGNYSISTSDEFSGSVEIYVSPSCLSQVSECWSPSYVGLTISYGQHIGGVNFVEL